jgi:hypothetical protein
MWTEADDRGETPALAQPEPPTCHPKCTEPLVLEQKGDRLLLHRPNRPHPGPDSVR